MFCTKGDFIADMDKLFDIFCRHLSRRRELEEQNNLCMSDRDYSFYEDKKNNTNKSVLI